MTKTMTTTAEIQAALAPLVATCGFRVTSLEARRHGVPERVLFDAAARGLAKIERVHCVGDRHIVTVYLVFA